MKLLRDHKSDDLIDCTRTMYPSRAHVVLGQRRLSTASSTFYGCVARGTALITTDACHLQLAEGGYFSVPGEADVAVDGMLVLFERLGYRGMLTCGVIETFGRLAYIDGCTSTMLVPPLRAGDPLLNHLHIPPGTDQSLHTHPSLRLGVVVRGSRWAIGREPETNSEWKEYLQPSSIFWIAAYESHAFSTVLTQQSLDIVTFHPESVWGPTDDNHPMLHQTHIDKTAPV